MSESKSYSELLGKKFDVLDHGFVVLVDAMGDDSSIVQAARVSYGKGTKSVNVDRGLIRYLMRHRHTTPFEMVEFKFHVKLPIFVARQWIRHRTANVNEYSARYSVLEDEFYMPEQEILANQSSTNKQGREGELAKEDADYILSKMDKHNKDSYDLYKHFLNEEEGDHDESRGQLTRELSRIVIPTNVYTQWYWKVDLHNLFHFLSLRMDSHAQYEIRVFAEVMADMVKQVCPMAYEAFEDYRLNAKYYSGPEVETMKLLFGDNKFTDDEIKAASEKSGLTNKRELTEFIKKMKDMTDNS